MGFMFDLVRRPHVRGGVLLAVGALLVGACTTDPTTSSPRVCRLSRELLPSCGVLWGVSVRKAPAQRLADLERTLGRPFDIVYHYQEIGGELPTPQERLEVRRGHILHVSIAARIYGLPNDRVTYADVAAGKYDAGLTAQARGIASLHVPVFVTFEQEANQHDKMGVRGGAAQFIAAWRHVHNVFERAGASNAVWVWVMTGAPRNLERAGTLWPGNDVVDWISWNVYNQSTCGSGDIQGSSYTSFRAALAPFYRWVHRQGRLFGIDPDKPMMVSESGSVTYPGASGITAHWYRQIPGVLSDFPQVKAFALWDDATSRACDFRFQEHAQVLAGVRAAGLDPRVYAKFRS